MRGLPWSGRLAVLPLFIALVVYGSVKNSGGVGSEGKETNRGFNAEVQSRGDA